MKKYQINNVDKIEERRLSEKCLNQKNKNNKKNDIFLIKPLDLTPKLYVHNNDKKKRNIQKTNKTHSLQSVLENKRKDFKFPVLQKMQKIPETKMSENKHRFVTKFRIDSANTDRRKALKTRFFKNPPYSSPRPHHFNDDIHRHVGET